jgi:antitoxin (DNA-binding transcriptional repressor) of toxin-antitoxin stability system
MWSDMQQIEISDLTLSLSALLASLGYGEEIVLTEDQHPVAKLIKLENGLRVDRGVEMAEILDRLAAHHPFAEIDDPVAWQREVRQDRSLPDRE